MPRHRWFLLEQHHARSRHNRPLALIALDLTGEQAQQGRLARAIAPDQRQSVTRGDENVEMAKQPARSLNQAQIFIGKDRRGHSSSIGNNTVSRLTRAFMAYSMQRPYATIR